MSAEGPHKLSLGWRVLHWAIILNLLAEFIYASVVIFVVLRPEGAGSGPLWGQAASIPADLMMRRRAYAIEAWIAFAGLAVYLGVTELLPRRLGRRG